MARRIGRPKKGDFDLLQKAPKTPEEMLASFESKYPIFFMEMNRAQDKFIRVKNRAGRTPRRRLYESGNKNGKTFIGIAEDLAYAWGYRPWLPEDDPDYRVDVKVPNQGMVAGETLLHSIAEKIEPMFRHLCPDLCDPQFKVGSTGTVIRMKINYTPDGENCGSIIHFRSYDQRADTFEGIDYDWVHWDEPPPEDIFKAAERGKAVTNAPSWLTMTPLKEAYIYNMFSSRAGIIV